MEIQKVMTEIDATVPVRFSAGEGRASLSLIAQYQILWSAKSSAAGERADDDTSGIAPPTDKSLSKLKGRQKQRADRSTRSAL